MVLYLSIAVQKVLKIRDVMKTKCKNVKFLEQCQLPKRLPPEVITLKTETVESR